MCATPLRPTPVSLFNSILLPCAFLVTSFLFSVSAVWACWGRNPRVGCFVFWFSMDWFELGADTDIWLPFSFACGYDSVLLLILEWPWYTGTDRYQWSEVGPCNLLIVLGDDGVLAHSFFSLFAGVSWPVTLILTLVIMQFDFGYW
jgi:hypothetical protein